jgi:hypothetical protein
LAVWRGLYHGIIRSGEVLNVTCEFHYMCKISDEITWLSTGPRFLPKHKSQWLVISRNGNRVALQHETEMPNAGIASVKFSVKGRIFNFFIALSSFLE